MKTKPRRPRKKTDGKVKYELAASTRSGVKQNK